MGGRRARQVVTGTMPVGLRGGQHRVVPTRLSYAFTNPQWKIHHLTSMTRTAWGSAQTTNELKSCTCFYHY